MDWYRHEGDELLLWLKVQPKASQDGFAEVLDDAIKLRITAPPVDGRANGHLLNWLANQFGVPKARVILENGQSARRKQVRIICPRKIPLALEKSGIKCL